MCFQLQPQLFPKALTVQWLILASGSYSRASRNLVLDIQNSDLDDIEMCRIINDRIMAVRPPQLGVHLLDECKNNVFDAYSADMHTCSVLNMPELFYELYTLAFKGPENQFS